MTILRNRKTRLILETPEVITGLPLVAEIENWGLNLRLKSQRYRLPITWASIYNRAAAISADRIREERRTLKASKKPT